MSAVLKVKDLAIRELEKTDIFPITQIEQASYKFPWSEKIFLDCMAAGYRCRVVEFRGKVAGYCVVATAVDEAHILNICVGPEFRREGCARLLIQNEISIAVNANLSSLYLEVRVSNLAAINLYAGLGFRQVGLRKDYYPIEGGREDAYIYSLSLENIKRGSNIHLKT